MIRRTIPRHLWVALALAILVLAVYARTVGFDFVLYDDDKYVMDNLEVRKGLTIETVRWAATSTFFSNWHPLTWLSYLLDAELFGLNPGAFHAVNILFHAANTALLFLVLRAMTGALWRSALVAALFAVHPLHVESVAWISERKDVLSTFFWILATGAYCRYVRRPTVPRYLAVLVLFAAGLTAKPMLVTLPFTLLLLDFWPLGRLGPRPEDALPGPSPRLVFLEKAPLFALAAASCTVTYLIQQHSGAADTMKTFSLAHRSANAIHSWVMYLVKTIRPVDLAAFYPFPHNPYPVWQVALFAVLLLGVSFLAVLKARRFGYLFTGWFWYLGTLVPVIGLVQVGGQSMADRYTYVPLVGIFVVTSWGLGDAALTRPALKKPLAAAAALSVVVFSGLTLLQAEHWRDTPSLLLHTIEVTSDNVTANTNLGVYYKRRGEIDKAVSRYREALRINPRHSRANYNMANILLAQGKLPEAATHYEAAISADPSYFWAHNNMGSALVQMNRHAEARPHFEKAATLSPDFLEANFNLGFTLSALGLHAEAERAYRKALLIAPANSQVHANLGLNLLELGKHAEAVRHLAEALRIDPGNAFARETLQRARVTGP